MILWRGLTYARVASTGTNTERANILLSALFLRNNTNRATRDIEIILLLKILFL